MTAAAKTHDSAATGQRFDAAIAGGAWHELALLSSEVQPMHDRLHMSYRFRAHKDQWHLIDVVCSGFRPEVVPPMEQL